MEQRTQKCHGVGLVCVEDAVTIAHIHALQSEERTDATVCLIVEEAQTVAKDCVVGGGD